MFRRKWLSPLTLVLCTFPAYSTLLQATQYADFDRYVLALSWQTGFCQSTHERWRNEPKECRLQKKSNTKIDLLTVHGLWPSLPKSISASGVNNRRWMRFGCATRPIPNMPKARVSHNKCSAAKTRISLEVAAKLNDVMPGAGDDSCFEHYQYAKHGVCFGFDPDAYFATMVRLNHEIKVSPLGQFLANNYGKAVTRGAFNEVIAQSWGKSNVKAVKLICSGNPAYLTEIQISLNAATINSSLSPSSFAPQPYSGNCGKRFVIYAVGY